MTWQGCSILVGGFVLTASAAWAADVLLKAVGESWITRRAIVGIVALVIMTPFVLIAVGVGGKP